MKYIILFISFFLFLGCTKVGINYQNTQLISFPKTYKDTNTSTKKLTNWWNIYHDPVLTKLIQKGYENNLDIKQAGIRILQARTLLGLSKGLTYPQAQTLNATAAITRQKGQNITSALTSFDLGWEIDFWGKYARGIENATANLYMSVASYHAIINTIIAEIARNYINYQVAKERIIYAKRNIAIQKKIFDITKIQYNAGNVSELDMQQAKTQLYTTKSKLPALKYSQHMALNALALLLAIPKEEVLHILQQKNIPNKLYQQNSLEIHDQNTTFSIIPTISINPNSFINISLLKRRPDIQVAQYKAKAQCAKIGMKEALLYPSFSLFGSIGINATAINGQWSSLSDSSVVSIGPNISWQILQYDRIKNQIRFEDARFEEALLGYNKAILQAINDVENAINGYMYTKQQLQANKQALKATIRAFNLSAKQYSEGLVSYQRLLSTTQQLTFTQDLYAQLQGNLALQSILLFKALGGSWQAFKDKDYIDKTIKQHFKDRKIDWGNYLKNTRITNE